jgi:hypothetical protein
MLDLNTKEPPHIHKYDKNFVQSKRIQNQQQQQK